MRTLALKIAHFAYVYGAPTKAPNGRGARESLPDRTLICVIFWGERRAFERKLWPTVCKCCADEIGAAVRLVGVVAGS